MADSATICPYFGGCEPPDMALAASPSWVLQGVNTSIAVYNTSGALQPGWPKNSQLFFGIPNPSPAGCSPSGPFTSDPRAFYDPNGGRFWVTMLEVEGAFGVNSCTFATKYWVAVSQTSNPNGAYFVYNFDMSLATTNAADYTQIGFDPRAFYFGGNMFNEIFGANKSSMMAGLGVSAYGFFGLSVGGVVVDTVQPVISQYLSTGPIAGGFVNSFNINGDPSGNDCFSTACHGITVWALANPGTSSTSLTGLYFANSANYIDPPLANEPGCTGCIETLDTRISGTPVLHNGAVWLAIETGVFNGSQTVPGILL
jgi:hypothetical protein